MVSPEMLDDVPRPVLAVLLLLPLDEKYQEAKMEKPVEQVV